jgi:hypothetical protein
VRRSYVFAVLLLPLLAGCASTYRAGYVYHALCGRSASVSASEGEVGRVDATVLGVRRDACDGRAAIDVRVRLERLGATAVALTAGDLRLVTRSHGTLGTAEVRCVGPRVPARGGASTCEASFALPGRDPGCFDLSALEIEVPVDVAGRAQTVTLGFARGVPAYVWPDPWEWPGRTPVGTPSGYRQ